MPWFWTCPHEYLFRKRTCPKRISDALAKVIDKYAKPRRWRAHSYCFLFVDGLIYWRIEDCINRTDRRALANNGHPSENTLKQIRRRFWPTSKERAQKPFQKS
jgi:hypothetical protein